MIAENLEKRRELQSLSSQDSASSLYSPKQEPSSTVQSPHSSIQTPPLPAASPPHTSRKKITPSVWKGFIDVPEVCKFFATAHPVHGSADCLKVVSIITDVQMYDIKTTCCFLLNVSSI